MKEVIRLLRDDNGIFYIECRDRQCLHQLNKKVAAKLRSEIIEWIG